VFPKILCRCHQIKRVMRPHLVVDPLPLPQGCVHVLQIQLPHVQVIKLLYDQTLSDLEYVLRSLNPVFCINCRDFFLDHVSPYGDKSQHEFGELPSIRKLASMHNSAHPSKADAYPKSVASYCPSLARRRYSDPVWHDDDVDYFCIDVQDWGYRNWDDFMETID